MAEIMDSPQLKKRIITKPVFFAFYSLVFIVVCSQGFLVYDFYSSKTEDMVIDVAGRQRMLSQRLAKNLLLLQVQQPDTESNNALASINVDLKHLKQTQLRLEKNNILESKQLTSQLVKSVLDVQNMIKAKLGDDKQLYNLIETYLKLEQKFIPLVDRMVAIQQQKIIATVRSYQTILWVSIAGTFFCFFMGLFFIIRPTIKKVRGSLSLLAKNNETQQQLIAELEQKNEDLEILTGFAKQNEEAMSAQALLVLRQKQFTDAIFNSSLEAIISITSLGSIHLFNKQAEVIFGYGADEVQGENIKILMPNPFKDAHDVYLHNYATTGKKNIIGFGREVKGQRKDGSIFPLFLRVVEIKTQGEHEFVGFVKDLSEIRRVEQQVRENDRRYKAVVEDQTDLICRYTKDFIFTFANQAYCRYFDLSIEDVIGKSVLDLLPAEIIEWFTDTHASLSIDKPIDIHEDETLHNGVLEWQHWSTRAIFAEDGKEIVEFQGVGSIVTDRKEAEINAVLAKDIADKANMAKSQFLSSMSHELRTPLNSIIGFSQLMELDEGDPLSESQLDSVLQINHAGNHLLKLINEILDLSSIESGQITLINETFDIKNVCDEVLSIVESLASKKSISLVTDCDSDKFWVVADYMRTKQIFLNLLSNAIKYNHQQGHIELQVEQQQQSIVINITDTGVGIKEEAFEELFKPFNRLGYEASAIEGTGIGLSLTKNLVEHMGGEIGVNSTFGEGSTFWVKLPASSEHGDDKQELEEQRILFKENSQLTSKCKLLYIEDNVANMELVHKIVKQLAGFSLLEAPNAEIGLEIFEQERPDIVLMDIDLPGMNGFEALAEIKSRFSWADKIPVIAVSSNAMAEEVEKGQHSEFYDYITKPIDITHLVDILSKLTDRF